MSYQIYERDGWIEVQVLEKTSPQELLTAIRDLQRRDPRKEVPDLWTFSEDSIVPYVEFPTIVASVKALCNGELVGCKTALVAKNEFQRVVMDLYRVAAKILRFEIGVFSSREQAIEWLKS